VRRCLSSATVGPSITHSYARGATTPEWLSVLSARARCPAPLRSPPHRTPSRCVLAFAAIIPQLVVRARRNSARTPTCRALVLRCSSRRRSGAGLVQPPLFSYPPRVVVLNRCRLDAAASLYAVQISYMFGSWRARAHTGIPFSRIVCPVPLALAGPRCRALAPARDCDARVHTCAALSGLSPA
jgi:hypothetical protein